MPTNKTTNKKRRTTTSTSSRSAIDTKVKVTVSVTAEAAEQLEQITKELGLSKSELFERISKGELVVAAEGQESAIAIHPGTEETVNLQPPAHVEGAVQPPAEDPQLKQQLEEQTNQIQALQQQVARIAELESQLAQTVPADTYETLKQQSQQQQQTITDLENQIARLSQLEETVTQTIAPETYNALQQELDQQKSTISALQHQLEEQHQALAQLHDQKARIAELEAKVSHSISPENYHALENLAATQKLQITQLQQRFNDLVPHHTEHHNGATATVGYDALKQYLEQQESMISTLQKQVSELQGLASIGESQLSKWRNRSFKG